MSEPEVEHDNFVAYIASSYTYVSRSFKRENPLFGPPPPPTPAPPLIYSPVTVLTIRTGPGNR